MAIKIGKGSLKESQVHLESSSYLVNQFVCVGEVGFLTLEQNGVLRYGHFGEILEFFGDRIGNG